MPPRKAAPAPKLVPSKDSFFLAHRPMVEQKNKTTNVTEQPKQALKEPTRRYLYENGTGLAYAELVGNTAVCIHTGVELYKLKGRDEASRGVLSMTLVFF